VAETIAKGAGLSELALAEGQNCEGGGLCDPGRRLAKGAAGYFQDCPEEAERRGGREITHQGSSCQGKTPQQILGLDSTARYAEKSDNYPQPLS